MAFIHSIPLLLKVPNASLVFVYVVDVIFPEIVIVLEILNIQIKMGMALCVTVFLYLKKDRGKRMSQNIRYSDLGF